MLPAWHSQLLRRRWEILESAWKALEAVRERTQASNDLALKANAGKLYDEFNLLRSATNLVPGPYWHTVLQAL